MPDTDKPSLPGAVALIVVGLLILIPSGLCTGLGLFSLFLDISHGFANTVGVAEMFLFIGGPFVLGGGALVWNGIHRIRARNAPRNDADTFQG